MDESKAQARLVFRGERVEDGTMDVRHLAPAFLSLGRLMESANSELNGTRAEVSVHVGEIRQGSFDILFELIQYVPDSVWELAKDYKTADDILMNLGLGSSFDRPSFVNLIELVKRLRGKMPSKDDIEVLEDNSVSIAVGDGAVNTTINVLNLGRSSSVVGSLQEVVKPVEIEGIDALEIRGPGGAVISEVSESDMPSFRPRALLEGSDSEELEEVSVQTLKVVQPSFDKSYIWRFDDENGDRISARMEDTRYLSSMY